MFLFVAYIVFIIIALIALYLSIRGLPNKVQAIFLTLYLIFLLVTCVIAIQWENIENTGLVGGLFLLCALTCFLMLINMSVVLRGGEWTVTGNSISRGLAITTFIILAFLGYITGNYLLTAVLATFVLFFVLI